MRVPLVSIAVAFFTAALLPNVATATSSDHALRFHGTGVNQVDRARIPVDDDIAGPNQSAPIDVGAGDFTLEFWLRGTTADNPTPGTQGGSSQFNHDWLHGNLLLDRSVIGSERGFGVSIGGGKIRFGTGQADQNPSDTDHTLFGSITVLDGTWHHVAVVRDATSGTKSIYVDGVLDVTSPANVSVDDLSYPDAGIVSGGSTWNPYLGIGAEKFDTSASHPPFKGYFDELRIWNTARSGPQIAAWRSFLPPLNSVGLVGSYRFEEGVGTTLADVSQFASPNGELVAGVVGNGEWTDASSNVDQVAPVSSGPLPPGFQRAKLVDLLNQPTSLVFAPDGRLFVGERLGDIHLFENGQFQATPIVQIPVSTFNGERGLLGLEVDPDFANNGYLYAYYTSPEPRNRVGRFTVVGNSISLASEFVVWQNTTLAGTSHHAGGIRFGADGHLYITTGDQVNSANSQDLSNQHGKLLRVAKDGSIPSSNPFVGVIGADPAIYALGLRNPFRIQRDDASGRLFIGDVGGNSSLAYEELNLVAKGANYGWPNQEGPICYAGSCAGISFPKFHWRHDDPVYVPAQHQGAIIAGPIYQGTAFPPEYRGNLFTMDYSNRWIRRLVLDDSGDVIADPVFMVPPIAENISDMAEGPDGALYYVTVGVIPHLTGVGDGALHWIYHVGSGNNPPIAMVSSDVTSGVPPFTVQFSSAGTVDPDQGPGLLSYLWDFGDGTTSALPNPSHVYTQKGVLTARLTVTDQLDPVISDPINIASGNAPVATVTAPVDGQLYNAGDLIFYTGSATDIDDGSIPPSSLSWEVLLVHAGHSHPFLGPSAGAAGAFVIPTTGHPPEDTHYEVRLTATDSDGLTDQVLITLLPRTATLVIDSVPSGIPFALDGQPEVTPRVIESLVGYKHVIDASAGATVNDVPHQFVCWSNGGPIDQTVTTPVTGLNLTALYGVAPTQMITTSVIANARNAEFHTSSGQQFANGNDPLALCVGSFNGTPIEAGLEFPLTIPPGATILEAHIELTATANQLGAPSFVVRGYDVGDAPPFVASSVTPLMGHAPLTSSAIPWTIATPTAGVTLLSPDLAPIVQAIVDRGDWSSGNHLGFMIAPDASVNDEHRCFTNFASLNAPRMRVTFSSSTSVGCGAACGFHSYGNGPATTHTLGLVGVGNPHPGQAFELRVSNAASPIVHHFASLAAAQINTFGGTLLVQPAQLLYFFSAPTVNATSTLSFSMPTLPGIVGTTFYFQAAAPDASLPLGYRFSNGLELEVCP